jgi:hypothetical protein
VTLRMLLEARNTELQLSSTDTYTHTHTAGESNA